MLIIKNGNIFTMSKFGNFKGNIIINNGKIIKLIKENLPDEELISAALKYSKSNNKPTFLDVKGLNIYPGLIEAHCHIGITEAKMGKEGDDCNEAVNPITPYLRALDAINPMDSAFSDAVRAGITSVMAGPGSSNVVGGQFMFLKTYGRDIEKLSVLEPAAVKVAFGENPKFTYSSNGSMPSTRMAIAAMLREELLCALNYYKKRQNALKSKSSNNNKNSSEEFKKDFRLEPYVPVFEGKIPLKAHVHRADDILTAIRVAKEFNISLTLDHCSEGHLIADEIAKSGFPAIVGPDLASRNKIEVRNMAFKTAGVLHKAGVLTAITTDHPVSLIQSLPLCAGLAAKCGLGKDEALKAITINPAVICRTDSRVGSIEEGKDADLAIFDGSPLEIFTNCIYTIIDGEIVHDFYKEQKNDYEGASPQFN